MELVQTQYDAAYKRNPGPFKEKKEEVKKADDKGDKGKDNKKELTQEELRKQAVMADPLFTWQRSGCNIVVFKQILSEYFKKENC